MNITNEEDTIGSELEVGYYEPIEAVGRFDENCIVYGYYYLFCPTLFVLFYI